MNVEPYLNFEGCCKEAIGFYQKALGAEVEMMMRNRESPDGGDPSKVPPGSEDKILHSSLRIGNSRVMATDGFNSGKSTFEGVTLAITVSSEADASRAFSALADGGQVTVPLMKTFFSPSFGMLVDRFGVAWMVYATQ